MVSPRSDGVADGGSEPDSLDEIAESFLERRRRGDLPTLSEYVARYPGHADDIRELFPALELMEELGSDGDSLPDLVDGTGSGAWGAEPAARAGPVLGEYRLLRVIGHGGMGVVYEAEQVSLGRRVALKVLGSRPHTSARQLERFQREARAAARLHHAHIVPVFGVGEDGGVHYYVMQFVNGSGLDEVVRQVRRLRDETRAQDASGDRAAAARTPLVSSGSELVGSSSTSSLRSFFRSVATIGKDVAAALAYAHGEGVVHRDIKPSNLLLDPRGHIWVADFGLAKDGSDDPLTQTGDIVGTVAYMAPERFDGWSDQRSDVYGLGLTLWELVAMRPAFQDRNRRRLVRRVAEDEPPSLRKIEPRTPRDLETIILKAIRKEPGHRYQTAGQMQADFERFLEGRPVQAQRVSSTALLLRWCHRNRTVASLTSLLVIVLAAAAGGAAVLAWKLEQRLLVSYLEEARAHVSSRSPGAATAALRTIALAADLGPSGEDVLELRRAAAAALARTDLRLDGRLEMSPSTRYVYLDDDLERVAELSHDGAVVVRKLPQGEAIRRLDSQGKPLDFARFGGRRWLAALSTGWTGDLFVWDLEAGKLALEAGATVYDRAVAFPSDGLRVATCDERGELVFHDLVSAERRVVYRGRPKPREVLFQPGGELAAISGGSTIELVDPSDGRLVRTISCGSTVSSSAWSASGEVLATACGDGRMRVWEVAGGTEVAAFAPPGEGAQSWARFVPGTDLLLGGDSRARLWRWRTGRQLLLLDGQRPAATVDGRYAAVLGNHAAEVRRIVPSRTCREIGFVEDRRKRIRDVDVDAAERLLAYSIDDGLRLWDLRESRQLAFLRLGATNGVRFDGEGRSLVTSGDRGLFVWPIELEAVAGRLRLGAPRRLGEQAGFVKLALDGRRRRVAAARGHDVHLFDLEGGGGGGGGARRVASHRYPSIAFDPRGSFLATGNWTGQDVRLWDTASGELVWTFPVPGNGLPLYSPDGEWLLLSSGRRFEMFHAPSREKRYEVRNHAGSTLPGAIAFSEVGIVALAIDRGSVLLAEIETGRELITLDFPIEDAINQLRFSRSGRWLIAAAGGTCFVQDLARLRTELEGLGLDWDRPPLRQDHESEHRPLEVEVALGELSE